MFDLIKQNRTNIIDQILFREELIHSSRCKTKKLDDFFISMEIELFKTIQNYSKP